MRYEAVLTKYYSSITKRVPGKHTHIFAKITVIFHIYSQWKKTGHNLESNLKYK